MNPTIDSFYTDGILHKHKGEDYALHGDDYFIICDGCSSANNSDVVARVQAHTALKFLDLFKSTYDPKHIGKLIGSRVRIICADLEIKGMPLATLMVGVIVNNTLRVFIYGDGNIAYKSKYLDTVGYVDISYTSNAPYYPYYYTLPNSLDLYHKRHKERLDKQGIPFTPAVKDIREYFKNQESQVQLSQDVEDPYYMELKLSNLNYLYLFSDGIHEFSGPGGRRTDIDATDDFLNIKNTNGVFIERRCKRQLSIYAKDGITPYDDFSMAGVFINDKQ